MALAVGLLPASFSCASHGQEDSELEEGAGDRGKGNASDSLAPRPGYVVGRAAFADGRPVPRLHVVVGGFTGSGTSGGGVPTVGVGDGEEGRYAVQTTDAYDKSKPADARVVTIKGFALLPYQGKEYRLPMYPVDGKPDTTDNGVFIGQSGAGLVRDFVLRLSGPRPGYEGRVAEQSTSEEPGQPEAFYGGTIVLDFAHHIEGTYQEDTTLYPPGSSVAVTLTPDGPLLDGSAGQALTRQFPPGEGGHYRFYLRDVPPGAYTAVAQVIESNGATHPLQINTAVGNYQPSAHAEFTPSTGLSGGVEPLRLYAGR